MSLGFIAYIIMMLIDKKENDKIYEKNFHENSNNVITPHET